MTPSTFLSLGEDENQTAKPAVAVRIAVTFDVRSGSFFKVAASFSNKIQSPRPIFVFLCFVSLFFRLLSEVLCFVSSFFRLPSEVLCFVSLFFRLPSEVLCFVSLFFRLLSEVLCFVCFFARRKIEVKRKMTSSVEPVKHIEKGWDVYTQTV